MKKLKKTDVINLINKKRSFVILIAIVTTSLVFLFSYGVLTPRRYPVKIGERSKWDVDAPFEMEDRIQTERNADEAVRAVPKAYVRDGALSAAIISKAEEFINTITQAHNAYRDTIMQNGAILTSTDIQNIRNESITELCELVKNFRIAISREEAGSIITEVKRTELDSFFSDFISKIRDFAENTDITSDNLNDQAIILSRSIQQTMYANQNLKNAASLYATSALSVNVVVDEEKTKQAQDGVREQYLERKIIIPKGKRIISVDERLTTSQYQLLYQNGLIETGKLDMERLAKLLFILVGMMILIIVYLSKAAVGYLESNSQVLQIGCVILFVMIACRFFYPLHRFSMPVYIAPILIGYLINYRVAMVINIYILSVISMYAGMDVKTMLLFLIGTTLSALMMVNASTRARFTLVAFVLSATSALMFMAISDSIMNLQGYIIDIVVLFITCVASSFLSMGLIALMESLFNTATPLRLTELSSGNTPLLRRLSFEAPGTHHHSLMVGYMAETAALEIGANPFITKTGAYYHDVGKLAAPGYFAENQNGQNPHDTMEPSESCKIIVSHTIEGVTLCEKSNLPRRVIDIVHEHHGNTVMLYFYNKAATQRGESNVSKDDYRYSGPRPTSRESALVMMADSCEAAVRSLEHKEDAKIAEYVHKIIKSKIEDNQFESCMISMNDILLIENSFIRVLIGFYHTRVKYPEEARLLQMKLTDYESVEQPAKVDQNAAATTAATAAAAAVAAMQSAASISRQPLAEQLRVAKKRK